MGKREIPPHANDVVVVLLEMDSSLLPYDPGQQIQTLPSIRDRIRMVASIIRPSSIMQTEMIVGQCDPPIRGLNRPGIPEPGSQSSWSSCGGLS